MTILDFHQLIIPKTPIEGYRYCDHPFGGVIMCSSRITNAPDNPKCVRGKIFTDQVIFECAYINIVEPLELLSKKGIIKRVCQYSLSSSDFLLS